MLITQPSYLWVAHDVLIVTRPTSQALRVTGVSWPARPSTSLIYRHRRGAVGASLRHFTGPRVCWVPLRIAEWNRRGDRHLAKLLASYRDVFGQRLCFRV